MKQAILAMTSFASNGILMLAVAFLTTIRLGPAEQGFFFAFLSFSALIQLADFGLSYATLQTASHYRGSGRSADLARFAACAFRWNLGIASTATVIVALVGASIFSLRNNNTGGEIIRWAWPWIWLMLGVFAAQLTAPAIALREGAGQVEQVWRLRLFQEWISGASCLAALGFGLGLGSLAVMWGCRAIVAGIWLTRAEQFAAKADTQPFSLRQWMAEIWPFQWRIGLSTLSGYLVFRVATVIVLLEQGPILAGQYGMAIAMMNMLLSFTTAWPMSQATRYGMLIAGNRFEELRRRLPVMIIASSLLAAILAASLSIVFWFIDSLGLGFAARLTDPGTTAIVLASAVVHHIVICFAMPLRAERREPFLLASIFGGIVTATAIWIAAHYGTARDIALTNLIFAIIGIPIAYHLFQIRNRYWPRT